MSNTKNTNNKSYSKYFYFNHKNPNSRFLIKIFLSQKNQIIKSQPKKWNFYSKDYSSPKNEFKIKNKIIVTIHNQVAKTSP